jgi:hypothetical protein
MNELKWRRPLWQIHLIFTVGMLGLFLVMWFVMMGPTLFDLISILVIVALISALIPGLVFARIRWKEVLHSTSSFVRIPSHEFIPRLEELLSDEGIPFTKQDRAHKVGSSIKVRWDAVFELFYGTLMVHIMASEGLTGFFIGPMREDNQAELDRVKDIISRIGSRTRP